LHTLHCPLAESLGSGISQDLLGMGPRDLSSQSSLKLLTFRFDIFKAAIGGHRVLEQTLGVGREGGEQEGEVPGCAGQESGEEVGHQVLEQTLGLWE
jgi:hypothetical protein